MAEPQLGVIAPWILPEDVIPESQGGTGCCPGLKDPYDPVMLNKAIVFATNILFRASGRQFPGVASRTLRPCSGVGGSGCGCSCAGGVDNGWGCGAGVLGITGGWNSWAWDIALGGWQTSYPYAAGLLCGCEGGCNGCVLPWVGLPSPVAELEEVTIDGVVQPLEEFAVQQYNRVVRKTLDSNGCLLGFPCVNVMSRESAPYGADPNDGSRDNTWQIKYRYGRGPGEDGEWACALYACQLSLLWCNASDPNCRLPGRIQTLAREQMTVEFVSFERFLSNGFTGLNEVDDWIRSVNPNSNIRRPSVSRLGRPNRNVQTFT